MTILSRWTVRQIVSTSLACADLKRTASAIATALYYTGIDPFTKKPVHVAKAMRDRKMQRALMLFFKPENWLTVREALLEAGRAGLIGNGCDCLIPSDPPKAAMEKRRRDPEVAEYGVTLEALAEVYNQARLAGAVDANDARSAGELFERLRGRVGRSGRSGRRPPFGRARLRQRMLVEEARASGSVRRLADELDALAQRTNRTPEDQVCAYRPSTGDA